MLLDIAAEANKTVEIINSPEINPKMPVKNIKPINTSLRKSVILISPKLVSLKFFI